jgi:histidyl-tRNA synthetase
MIGGKPTPAIGFAAGIERLVALVEAAASAPPVAAPHAYLVVEDVEGTREAMALAERLRDRLPALRLQVHMGGGSLKSQLRRADRSGAALAIIRGSDEMAAGEASIKDLRGDAAQRRVRIDALEDTLSPLCAQ